MIEYHELDTIAVREFATRLIDSVIAASGGSITPDSIDVIFTTTGGRLLHYSNLQPGLNKQVLQTLAGAAVWVTDPELPDIVAQHFYSMSIDPWNRADTSNSKHVLYVSSLDREYPIAHGSSYSGVSANIFIRGGTTKHRYSATMVTVGSGTTALAAGDVLILRFFPMNVAATDKYLKVYRLPDGQSAFGQSYYGEYIGYFLIPYADFPASGTVNLSVTLSYKVQQ